MKSKEFLEFLSEREAPCERLKNNVRKDILLSFQKKSIVTKFLAFQIIGALFSLSFCPQFGLGFVEGHGIAHYFRMLGDFACAAFCGSLFLSSGMVVAFMGMKGEELWWIWERYKFSFVLFPAALWSSLMLTNMSLNLPKETLSYHVVWVITAILAQGLLLKFRSFSYLRFQGSRG